ncbi:c-Myc-binding protein [Planococcus citri]|uniref:c-Myc-binding protein n=1 Tax=Planococcus citri TaxID=170843 RepID=UPI0031F9B124
MMPSRSIDSKREEFRKYLETAGVMDTITRILTMIYECTDKPADPLQFLRDEILKSSPVLLEETANAKYLESARERITKLETENENLKKEIERLKAAAFSQNRLPPVEE